MNDLKPCPFCGSTDIGPTGEGYLYCADCEADGPNGNVDTQRDNWNRRALPELPEGYLTREGSSLWCEGFGYVAELDDEGRIIPGPPIQPRHFPALAIWLQRRANK